MSAPITVWPENMVRFTKQEIENHGGSVELVLPNGDSGSDTDADYPSNHESLSESIADALQYAQEHAKQNAQATP